jgi:hypothetical protein
MHGACCGVLLILLCVWLSVTVRFSAEQKKETRQSQQTHDLHFSSDPLLMDQASQKGS